MQAAGLKELLGLVTAGAAVVLILIRYGLRKPPELATTDEVAGLKVALGELKEELREYRLGCASKSDVTALGEKVARIDAFHLTLNDRSIRASQRSTRALREVAGLTDRIAEIHDEVRELRALPAMLGRIEERIANLAERRTP